MTRCAGVSMAFALCAAAIAGGCGGHESAAPIQDGVVPATSAWVFLATALACKDLRSEDARFTPLVVRGPGYARTLVPHDDCRKQHSGIWWSYGYRVPVPPSGQLRLTAGNQPTAILDAGRLQSNHAATIYFVDCPDYYADCGDGPHFQGRISAIEYFKDEDVSDAPN